MITALLLAALACSPAMPQTKVFEGPGVKLRQTAHDWTATLELLGPDGKTRWRIAETDGLFSPIFSPDGRYVAEARTAHSEAVIVIGPDGKLATYHPLKLVTEDEKSVMSETSCGLGWFAGLRFDGGTLVVLVQQAQLRPPMYEPDPTPKLEISIDLATGRLGRTTPPKVVSVAGLIADYRARPDARSEVAEGLARKAWQRAKADAPVLLAFAKEELPRAQSPEVQEALLVVLNAVGADADREWVGARALEAGWPAERVLQVLQGHSRPEALRAYSRVVLEKRLGNLNARATAVRALVGTPEGVKYVRLALADPEEYVRHSARLVLANLPADEKTFAFLIENAGEEGARQALVERFACEGPQGRWPRRFEKACDGGLRQRWPGCEAWTGAMADVRGDEGLALARYERALTWLSKELEQEKGWSWEAEVFTRLHVRLARLAKAAGRVRDVQAHVEALRRSPWWNLECANGLPRGIGECDGLLVRDLLISELLDTAKRP